MPNLQEKTIGVLQDANFDPMEILMTQGGKVSPDTFKADDPNDDQQNNDDAGAGGQQLTPGQKAAAKAAAERVKPDKGIDFSQIQISDDDVLSGLQKTREREEGNKGAQGVADRSRQQQQQQQKPGAQQQPAKKPDQQQQQQQQNPPKGGGGNTADANDNNPNPNSAVSVFYNMMVEAGEWEAIDDFDGTPEAYQRAKEHNWDKAIDNSVDDYLAEAFERHPEGKVMGKKLLSHLMNGGRLRDFMTMQSSLEYDFDAINGTDDEAAERAALELLPDYYASIGWKKPNIDLKMAQLKKLGGVVDEAKLIGPTFKEQNELRAANHAKQLAANKKTEEANINKVNNALLTMINKGHSFGAIQVGKDKKDKVEYQNYFFVPDDKTGITPFASDYREAMADPEFLLYVAAAWRNKLHKNPDAVVDPKTSTQKAMNSIEDKLSASLLNKSFNNGQSLDPALGKNPGQGGQGGNSKLEFNLDDAIPIYIN